MENNLKSFVMTTIVIAFLSLPKISTAFPIGQGVFGSSVFGDTDGDLVQDELDAFPADPTEAIDSDNDGFGNNSDFFPNLASEWVDKDGDGFGDNTDVFPDDPTESSDSDGDDVGDNADAFPLISLGSLSDTDGDGYPNDCNQDCLDIGMTSDLDDDNDGIGDLDDAFPLNASESLDTDGDGEGNNTDDDIDGDGTLNADDAFPLDPQEDTDANNNGLGDNEERNVVEAARQEGVAEVVSDPSAFGLIEETGFVLEVGVFDIDGDGESKPLTDGLLLIRYLFGFSGDSLISGAVGTGATRDTSEQVEAYINERIPAE
jgi:hypothetical protein